MTTKEFVWYHEAVVGIYLPEVILQNKEVNKKGKIVKGKGKIKIPESYLYSKEIFFFDDKKVTLKTNKEKLNTILKSIKLNLKLHHSLLLKFKTITKTKKL